MSALDWERDGRDWPHRAASRFVEAGGLAWHVQQMGEGPALLLLHGTGAATHSWRGVMPPLAEYFTVIAPDLPGHGFTRGRPPGGLSLAAMHRGLSALLDEIGETPAMLVGHSAGAAIAAHMAIVGNLRVPIVGFNPALMPFPGLAAKLFPAMAKMLFVNPFVPRIFARLARVPGETGRFLVRSTGSHIDAEGVRGYETLLGNSGHCQGALAMMADWDLEALKRTLPGLSVPVLLVHGDRDSAVPLSSVREAADLMPDARVELLEGLGHLAHEEQRERAADLIARFAAEHAIIDPQPADGG